jgi:hypothetical protein
MTRIVKWLALSVLALAFPVVNTHASIPAADGTYTGCLFKALGTVRLIDTAISSQRCVAGEVQIKWNQKGPMGLPGVAGPQGTQGLQGVAGSPGRDGAPGAQGIQGIKGDTGAQGVPGAKGDAGATGAQGVQGQAGVDGKSITASEFGTTDPRCAFMGGFEIWQHAPGAVPADTSLGLVCNGLKGDSGLQGVAGTPGAPGQNGAPGAPGQNGTPGAQGAQGVEGPQGAQGVQGPKGDQGPAGGAVAPFNAYRMYFRLPPKPIPPAGYGVVPLPMTTVTTGAGYLLVRATGYCIQFAEAGSDGLPIAGFYLYLNDSPVIGSDNYLDSLVRAHPTAIGQSISQSFAIEGLFQVNPGVHTFFLWGGSLGSGSGDCIVTLSAQFSETVLH